jgi:hypothetical protein
MQAAIAALSTDVLVSGSRFELVPDVGHFTQLESPARVNGLIADWISPSVEMGRECSVDVPEPDGPTIATSSLA